MYVKEILVERTEKGLYWENPVRVTRNHRADDIVGEAWILEVNGKYYADLSDLTVDPTGFYPSIGYITVSDDPNNPVGKIFELGLCDKANEDETIQPIGLGNGEVKGAL